LTLYLDYDQAALDRQYNNRAAVPDAENYFRDWAARSAETRARLDAELSVPYGESEPERFDLFPAQEKAAPLHVFFHGGYWQAMDKSDFSFLAEGLVSSGIACAVVGYALAPNVTMDEIVRQARASLVALYRMADRFGYDRERISVSGHSAGGHLAAIACLTDWPGIDAALPAGLVTAGTAISGLFDLEPIRLTYLNGNLRLDSRAAARNSPIRLPMQGARPMRLVVGERESAEYHRQMTSFADALTRAGHPPETHTLKECHHFSVIEPLATPGSLLNRLITAQAKGTAPINQDRPRDGK
jgi:arylformamidase